MENIVEIAYAQTGKSSHTNDLGMREMQQKVYSSRGHQYILLKAPPASGKSRALMFVALDKLVYQGIRKVIVAVPEKSIGRSFQNTALMKFGFTTDWEVAPYFNLCDVDNEQNKVGRFKEFLGYKGANVLVCTHATLRFAAKELSDDAFDGCLLAIDEFHHASADEASGLGDLVRRLMKNSTAHIMAMTGSYFRGDGVPVLRPEEEDQFHRVTYNYYEQLNGYKYLKSLGIGYHFYQGQYLSAISDVLDREKKTIIHIPSVNSKANTGDKYDEVDSICKMLGEKVDEDYITGIKTIKTPEGKLLKVADLVEDNPKERNHIQAYLQKMKHQDDVDIIIALGTAKEGFDWQHCEHCLTVGVRGSLTEVVQIIGRCTRDSEGKAHAQFTNLIAAPEAAQAKVEVAVNDMLKAITASLLMEQVMAPVWTFRSRKEDESVGGTGDKGTLVIEGLKKLSSAKTIHIVENDLTDLKAIILQSDMVVKAMGGGVAPEMINQVYIPKIIQEKYPDLTADEAEEIRQHIVLDTVTKGAEIVEGSDGTRFLKISNRFINIDDLSINLIDTINPFQRAYEIMSKQVTAPILKVIQDSIESQRNDITIEEAVIMIKNHLPAYQEKYGDKLPDKNSPEPMIRRLAQAITFVRNAKMKAMQK